MIKTLLVSAVCVLAIAATAEAATLSRNTSVESTSVEHNAPTGAFALTQSGSMTITGGNSVSCNTGSPGFFHRPNNYYRRLNLDVDFGATGTVNVSSVDIGIENANGATGSQPITVNLYAPLNAAPMTIAGLGAAVATVNLVVTNQTATLLNVPIAAAINSLTNDLVVEVSAPDGMAPTNNTFFIGSNTTASINPAGAPSYIRASDCGIAEPATTASIGFAGMNIVMVVRATTLPVTLQGFSVD